MEASFYDEYFEMEDNHWWFRGRLAILTRLLRSQLRGPMRILDIGSGGGGVAKVLTEFGNVTASDIDPRCAEAVQRRQGMAFAFASAENLTFSDASFDLVTAFDVLEHVEDDLAVLSKMARLVGAGGAIVVTVPAYRWLWSPHDEFSGHRRRYTKRSLRLLFEAAGLKVQRLTAYNSLLLPAIAAVRLARRIVPEKPGQIRSDNSTTKPGLINDLLAAVFGVERFPLARMNLPMGVSLFAYAFVPKSAIRNPTPTGGTTKVASLPQIADEAVLVGSGARMP